MYRPQLPKLKQTDAWPTLPIPRNKTASIKPPAIKNTQFNLMTCHESRELLPNQFPVHSIISLFMYTPESQLGFKCQTWRREGQFI